MGSAWIFIWWVTLIDVAYAQYHASTFNEWESSPLALELGVNGACIFRILTVLFAQIVITIGKQHWATRLLVVVNALLLGWYAQLCFL